MPNNIIYQKGGGVGVGGKEQALTTCWNIIINMHMKSQLCQREVFKWSEFPYSGITPWGLYISYLFIYFPWDLYCCLAERNKNVTKIFLNPLK